MLCNFLCSNVIWQKAASSSGGPQLSKHQSLCLNFIVNPSTKVRLGAAICRMTSCVCMELPSVLNFWRLLQVVPADMLFS